MKRLLPLFLLAACASPEPDYYKLHAVDGAPGPRTDIKIEVRRPGVPASLARPEMTLADGQYRVRSDSGDVWADPLDREIERTLALDLAQRLPGATVFTESGGLTLEPDYVVDTEWLGFEPDANGKSRLTVQTLVSQPRIAETAATPPLMLEQAATGSGSALAQTLSGLVGQVADRLAGDIRALPPTPPSPPVSPSAATPRMPGAPVVMTVPEYP